MSSAGNPLPAACGGNAHTQLQHLRANREFQRQEKQEKTQIDWATTITREQSRQHIRRDLNAKINLKAPREGSRGAMDTPNGQETMRRLARRIQGRHRLSPGDLLGIGPKLGSRMVRSADPYNLYQDSRGNDVPPREEGFPQKIRERLATLRELRALLARQGASPRRHREADIILVYACRQCSNLLHREMVEKPEGGYQACPVCRHSLTPERDLTPVAVRNDGSREPIGSPECHRRRR